MRFSQGRLAITYYTSDKLSEIFYVRYDVGVLTIDALMGDVYGTELKEPLFIETSIEDHERWLLEQSERDDVVVTGGVVIPIVGHVEPRPDLGYRYFQHRKHTTPDKIIQAWQNSLDSISINADVYLDGERVCSTIELDMPRLPEDQLMQRIIQWAVEIVTQKSLEIKERLCILKSYLPEQAERSDIPY